MVMTARPPKHRTPGRVSEPLASPAIGAGEFKAHCLSLMDDVSTFGHSYIITKRGKPVAKLVPVDEGPARDTSGFGALRGTVTILGDIVGPFEELGAWTHDARNL
jgi:prevent-host-death family protein